MCLAVLSWQPNSEFPLTVVANRDEFRARPTQAMHWWKNGILAGKDLQAGGTWLGVNQSRRFALLTNIRPGYIGVKAERSRGELVTQFLTQDVSIEHYQKSIQPNIAHYAGFNLVLGDGEQLFWFSSDHPDGKFLAPGIYGLSNDALNTGWPKLDLAKQQLSEQLESVQHTLTQHTVLQSTAQASSHRLPNTGLSPEWEAMLSAQCILGESYGTRSRSHIVQNKLGELRICEQQINSQGHITASAQWVI